MATTTIQARLIVAADGDALKAAVAKHILASAKAAIAARGRFTLALSGGSMPQTLSGLATSPEGHGVDWARVLVFFSDERCVPLDHEDSNYKACAAALLDKLPIPKENVFGIDASLPSAEAMAQDYQARMLKAFASQGVAEAGPVVFDAILLGMGPDGHTASLFPGHPLLQEAGQQVAAITDSPKPPPERITLTFPVLNAAREVAFIAAGGSKAALFQEAFAAEGANDGAVSIRPGLPYPAFQVRPAAPGALYWYTDAAGASLLPEEVKARAQHEQGAKL